MLNEKVLIIEDDVDNGFAALAAMEKLEYDCVLVGNVEDAVKLMDKEVFFGILTDMNMPLKQSDSVNPEAGNIILKECSRRCIPVVMITGGVFHHGKPTISIMVPVCPTTFSPTQMVSITKKGQVDRNNKDIDIWEKGWKILLEHYGNTKEIFESRKMYFHYVGEIFKQF